MLTTRYDLDMQSGGVLCVVPVSQYDVGSRQIVFNLYSSEGTLELPSGVQAEVRGTKPDGNGFSYAASISGLSVTVTVTAQMTAIAGKVRCELILYSGNPSSPSYFQLGTANFIMSVERAALDKDTLRSGSEIRQLVDVIDNSANIIAAAQMAADAVSQVEQYVNATAQNAASAEESAETAQNAVNGAISAIEQEYQADVLDIQEVYIDALNEIRDVTSHLLAVWRSEYFEDSKELRQLKETALDAVLRAYEGYVDSIENTFNADSTEMRTTHTSNLAELADAFREDMAALSGAYAEMMAALELRKNASINEMTGDFDEMMDELLVKFSEIVAVKTTADNTAANAVSIAQDASANAANALEKATTAENASAELAASVENMKQKQELADLQLLSCVNGCYEDGEYNVFTHDNVELFRVLKGGGGGGGGSGSGNNATITISNTSGWMSKTIAKSENMSCPVNFSWSSLENDIPTGNGSLAIRVNQSLKGSLEVQQGNVTVDVAPYLNSGSNVVSLTVSDIYMNSRTINITVLVVELSLSSTFDSSAPFTSVISFPYTPVGAVAKTVYFVLDGRTIGTVETSVSARQMTYTIPQQTHGAHTLVAYFESDVNGQTVRSNELYYEIISVNPLDNTPIITSNFNKSAAVQYATLNVPFTVYNPESLTAEVEIYVNDELASTQTVDRTEQTFAYRADAAGALSIRIESGTASKTISVTVSESDIHAEAETDNLSLHLTSYGRSNNEAHPEIWEDSGNNIAAVMTNFNFITDGWQRDEDGITVCRVAGDARITIPYQIFAEDFRGSGKTIEVEFATRDVMNYDATILSCLSEGRGLTMTAQKATLTSEQSEISMQYKEDEHVRIAFVAERRSKNRLLYVYVNGIVSGAVQYPTSDDFQQTTPVGISIGSNDCTTDIYRIRVYDNDLTSTQVLENWIADSQNVDQMIERYNRNNVYDAYGNIVISKLPGSLPYAIIECDELPQFKGDKKTCSITYIDPVTPSKSFTATGVQIDVQGTSSQYYARKNYKLKFKNGFVLNNGTTVKKYALRPGQIATNVFCWKADVASSEGANNVELAILYNDACPYKTPAQVENSAVRQGIDGFPMVVFHGDQFLGKYNFNHDKSAEEVFGFTDGDVSYEVKNNTSDRVLWKSDDYSGQAWLNDFEARFPDTDPPFTDPAQLADFASFMVSVDPDQATGDALDEAITIIDGEESTTYTNDTAAYRKAKFKAEIGNYVEMDSLLFYYLFTELFLMVDSRAKNMFPSFIGETISA